MSLRSVAAAIAFIGASGGAASAQVPVARFEVELVTDSTLAFRVGGYRWIKAGLRGVAVDPKRRDQMVARFQVLSVEAGIANAVITGQTTDVSVEHVATLSVPRASWYRRGAFWLGLVVGGLLGAVGGLAAT